MTFLILFLIRLLNPYSVSDIPFALVYFAVAELGVWLSVALLYYFAFTRCDHSRIKNCIGLVGSSLCLLGYLYAVKLMTSNRGFLSWETIDYLNDYPTYPFVPQWLEVVLYILCGLAALAILATLILCTVHLLRRQRFSRKQIIVLTTPLWLFVAVSFVSDLCFVAAGGKAILLMIGIPELILVLTLTLTGKKQSSWSKAKQSAPPCGRTR